MARPITTKALFTADNQNTEAASEVYEWAFKSCQQILDFYVAQGYSPRALASLMFQAMTMAMLEAVLGQRISEDDTPAQHTHHNAK